MSEQSADMDAPEADSIPAQGALSDREAYREMEREFGLEHCEGYYTNI